jgi:hypothetical protein
MRMRVDSSISPATRHSINSTTVIEMTNTISWFPGSELKPSATTTAP